MKQIAAHWQAWLWWAGGLAAAVGIALLCHYIVFSAAKRVARRTGNRLDDSLIRHGEKPAKLIFPLIAAFLVLRVTPLPRDLSNPISHLISLALIASIAWLFIALIDVVEDLVVERYRTDVPDNLLARRIKTQVQVLRRLAIVTIGVIALSIMLMTFPSIWHLGAGLFASAGVAGLVIGMAARPTLSNLLAGVQLALTEPIRIDDVVIVEGEWGWIEEISTTYVVVRIWDLRRLIVPLSHFIEQPFQNWTRVTADLLGTVYVYTDYTVPVEEVRQELRRILESSGMWDGKVCVLQVTNATEHAMELRALMSAPDSGKAWDLRCYVREKLIGFLQTRYPESLPRTRAEIATLQPDPPAANQTQIPKNPKPPSTTHT